MAAGAGRTGLALVLLHSGARVEAVEGAGDGGGTALHAAASGGHTITALTLLRHGCPLHALDGRGHSAPAVALLRGHEQCALAMLREADEADTLRLIRQQLEQGPRGA